MLHLLKWLDIRKELIEKNLIKAVIQLPSNLITNTAYNFIILQKTIAIRLHLLMLKFILKGQNAEYF